MAERTTLYPTGTGPGGAPHYLSIQGELIGRASGTTSAQYGQASSDAAFTGAAAEGRYLAELAAKLAALVDELTKIHRERDDLRKELQAIGGQLQRDLAGVRRRATLTAFMVFAIAGAAAAFYFGVADLPQKKVAANPIPTAGEARGKIEPAPPVIPKDATAASPSAAAPPTEKPGDAVY